MPWRNFLSLDFRTKFQREVPLFCRYLYFLTTQCIGFVDKSLCAKKTSTIRLSVSIELRLVTDADTDRQTDTGP